MRDGDVEVALSVLYQPFDEIDLTQDYGAPPRESYFDDIVAQHETVENYVRTHSGDLAIAHSVTQLDGLKRPGEQVPLDPAAPPARPADAAVKPTSASAHP